MSIHQLNIYGQDKVQVAIERFQTFEPVAGEYGYYLAEGKNPTWKDADDVMSWWLASY